MQGHVRYPVAVVLLSAVHVGNLLCAQRLAAQDELRPSQLTALEEADRRAQQLNQVNHTIWQLAELGLEEHQSSALLVQILRQEGFEVTTGVSGMPTAFAARYGSGRPIIGILAEYDALPGMSQQVAPVRQPVQDGEAGHACGHSGLGTGALGAVLAVKAAMEQHHLPGTIRLYGTPAEETLIGKVYMTLDGQFDDLDICLHWHPSDENQAATVSSKAMISAKFTFSGTPSHASVSPESGRSALDAVELMNIGANYMREHLKEDARIHYVIIDGGGAPNVIPPKATVWYFCRADSHDDAQQNFRWLQDIAEGAAKMTQTTMSIEIDTDCHEIIPNTPLAELLTGNLAKVAPPTYTDDEILFARRLQEPLVHQFGTAFPFAIDDRIHPAVSEKKTTGGSTDVGDISWRVPTGGLRTACFAHQSPGHSWQNVAAIGSSIGEKGILYAAKVLAITTLDLIERPELVQAARADWQERMRDRKYTTLIPEGQPPPQRIR